MAKHSSKSTKPKTLDLVSQVCLALSNHFVFSLHISLAAELSDPKNFQIIYRWLQKQMGRTKNSAFTSAVGERAELYVAIFMEAFTNYSVCQMQAKLLGTILNMLLVLLQLFLLWTIPLWHTSSIILFYPLTQSVFSYVKGSTDGRSVAIKTMGFC